jgi:MSHA biogenesis protein MshJ
MRQRVRTWWGRRAPRERALAVAVLVVLGAALLESLGLGPQRAATAQAVRQLAAARKHLEQVEALAAQQAASTESALHQRRETLAARRVQATQVIDAAQVDLIDPQEMTRQLEAILARHPALRVVGMASIAPAPLAGPGDGRAATGIFRHGLQVQIEGPYLELLGYLEALEHAPYRLYWRELDLRVGATGVPVTSLVFFTLSRESTWLRL